MKRTLRMALSAVTPVGVLSTPFAFAQTDKKPSDKPKPAPIIIKATAHTAHFNDFQIRRSKDRSLDAEVKKKGLDVAFTEWMQKDHPSVFKAECVKQTGEIATEYKST